MATAVPDARPQLAVAATGRRQTGRVWAACRIGSDSQTRSPARCRFPTARSPLVCARCLPSVTTRCSRGFHRWPGGLLENRGESPQREHASRYQPCPNGRVGAEANETTSVSLTHQHADAHMEAGVPCRSTFALVGWPRTCCRKRGRHRTPHVHSQTCYSTSRTDSRSRCCQASGRRSWHNQMARDRHARAQSWRTRLG